MDLDLNNIKDKATDVADKAAETAGDLFDKAKAAAANVDVDAALETAKGVAAKVGEGAGELIGKAKEAAPGVVEGAKTAVGTVKDFIEEKTGLDIDGDGKVGKGE